MHIYTGTDISFQGPTGFKVVTKDHPKFTEIVSLCDSKDYAGAAELTDIKSVVEQLVDGSDVDLVGSQLFYKGEVVSGLLGERIIKMANLGLSVDSLIAFLGNLQDNPSSRAVEELYGFLESSKLPITDDGHFLAYKSVKQDYTDHHSGKIDNSVGQVITMVRHKVDEDKDQTCSYGLHFAAHEYAEGFGCSGRMMVMKINPRDVVSIPSDYNNQKGRCCRYEVLEEVSRDDTKLVGASVVDTGNTRGTQDTSGSRGHQLKAGDAVQLSARGIEEWCYLGESALNSGNPKNTRGILNTNDSPLSDFIYSVTWANGSDNSYREGDLEAYGTVVTKGTQGTQGTKDIYAPQVDNYCDENIWDCIDIFIGTARQFPVNRQTTYVLNRLSNDKQYGDYAFCAYDVEHDNLKFYSSYDDNYVTVSDLSDWTIEWLSIVDSDFED